MDEAPERALRARLESALGAQFEIGALLGAGGFAAVFRGRDRLLGRDAAIKVIDPSRALNEAAAARLVDEARLVASIEHPHIVPLYEAGIRDGLVYLVMRYYPDGTLGARLTREGPLPAAALVRLGIEVAEALAAAHARGVVHLDLKPDNILLDGAGHAAVTDFGIARAMAGAGQTPLNEVVGTPHYMSPEQVAGDALDGRADVYALGVVLYELATGQKPIGGETPTRVLANHLRQTPVALDQLVPDIPTALAHVITRALAKDPAARWASTREMGQALREAGTADRLLSPRQARRRARRRWYVRMAMVVAGLMAGTGLIGYAAVRLFTTFTTGDPPAIDAMAPLIPASLLDSARTRGLVAPDDTVLYVFAPSGSDLPGALFVTSRHIVAPVRGSQTRYPRSVDYQVNLSRTNRIGFLVITHPVTRETDTIYRGMSGLEQQILGLGLRRVMRRPPPP